MSKSKEIFIVLRDTASNFESQVKVLKVSTDFNDALATHKENVEKARQLAKEMNYNISESIGDLSFISINPDNPAGEHYNVWMIRQQLSGEDKKDIGTLLSDSLETLKGITESGYWPYRSPAPCSTEVKIKKNIDRAIDGLSLALICHKEMFGKTKRDPMACMRSVIEENKYGILTVTKGSKDCEKVFKAKWDGIDREDMTDEQLTAFIEDCFTLYETTGFADTFRSPYSDKSDYNGRPFKVIRRTTAEECDIESMPMWVVKIEGSDDEVFCFPEEICKLERK